MTDKLTMKDFKTDQEVRWCPGCGDYAILAAMQSFMPELGIERERTVFVSGIGCAARFPYYMNTYGMHSIHGRAPAIATGLASSRRDLSVWVVTGDGDALSIGGNHLIHALRRNVNFKILLFNNKIYGLTKGQYSPTSELGMVTKSTPMGSLDFPFNPLSLAIGAEATFVARCIDTDKAGTTEVLRAAAQHRGSAFVEIFQNCPIFNDDAWDFVRDDKEGVNRIILQSGSPILWGADHEKALRQRSDGSIEVCRSSDDGVLVHDARARVCVARLRAHPRHAVDARWHAGRRLPERAAARLRRADGRADRDGDGQAGQGRPRRAAAQRRDLADRLGLALRLVEREVEVVAVRVHVERPAGEHRRSGFVEEHDRTALADDLVARLCLRSELELERRFAVAVVRAGDAETAHRPDLRVLDDPADRLDRLFRQHEHCSSVTPRSGTKPERDAGPDATATRRPAQCHPIRLNRFRRGDERLLERTLELTAAEGFHHMGNGRERLRLAVRSVDAHAEDRQLGEPAPVAAGEPHARTRRRFQQQQVGLLPLDPLAWADGAVPESLAQQLE